MGYLFQHPASGIGWYRSVKWRDLPRIKGFRFPRSVIGNAAGLAAWKPC